MIVIVSKKKHIKTILRDYPDAQIVDTTSKAEGDFIKFSPFYPHGHIPVPMMDEESECMEGIWQGLKVFEHEGVNLKSFRNNRMKGLIRSITEKRGNILGHQYGDRLLGYIEAHQKIFFPCYNYVLEHYCQDILQQLHEMSKKGTLVLLDYDPRGNVYDINQPMGHSALIKHYLETHFDSEE